jgi:hypothetical protein
VDNDDDSDWTMILTALPNNDGEGKNVHAKS